ncbi:MAG: TIR domain-containing protein [Ktedonobacterales bacterium]|nr:TIR domain-containing protein [Ktedonobacterales bacterium]
MDKPKVFISHATPDAEFATKLAHDLRGEDINVWLDTTHMTSGNYVAQLNAAMQRDMLILVLTPAAIRSEWVQEEVNTAIARAKQGLMRPPIVVVAKHCPPSEIPAMWSALHYYDATESQYTSAILRVVREINYGGKPVTRPLPPANQTNIPVGANQDGIRLVLEKDQAVDITSLGTVVQLEMRWGVSKAAANAVKDQEFDVDYAIFACHGSITAPEAARITSEHDIVYWPDSNHIFPFGSSPSMAAITRSADERFGGNVLAPDEMGTIDFSKLPADIVRIVLYIHIYKGSTRVMTLGDQRTTQLFKHADVRFRVLSTTGNAQYVDINLGQKYPENWGIVLCEFLKNVSDQWRIKSVLQPIDGDYIDECIRRYQLAAQ